MIPENLKNKIINTTIDISQYINDEYFSINNNVAYLVKVGKIRMIKVDVTLKKEINTDIYLFNFPTNFLDIINTYFFGNLIDRSGKSYDVAFYNQLESNNFSILIQPQYDNPITVESRIIGEWVGFCKSADTDINAEDDKYLNKEEVQALISEALDGAILKETFEKSQAEQDKKIQKLQNALIDESTEQDTSIHISDASDVPAVLSIEGNHYQEQQEGTSNLAVLNEVSITQDGITVNVQDGVATVSGTNTSDTATYITIGTAYLYANKTYYLRKEQGTAVGGYSLYKNGQTKWFEATGESSIDVSETGEWDLRYSVGANASVSGTLKFGVYENAETEYVVGEKAIPSVEYPSSVETVSETQKIIILNNNIFDNQMEKGDITAYAGVNASSTTRIRSKNYISLFNMKKIRIIRNDGNSAATIGLRFYDKDKNFLGYSATALTGLVDLTSILSNILEKGAKYFRFVVVDETDLTKKYGINLDNSTEFIEHEQKEYNLSVQQEMLQNDYFNTEKEIHKWGYINTKNVTNLAVSLNTSNEDFRRYSVDLKINDRKTGEYLKILCTHFKYKDSRWHEYEGICGWESGQTLCIGTFNKELDTAEKMKNYLLNNDVEIYYELAEQEELDLTEEQKETLSQLNALELFKGVNNIYTEQNLALLQLNYTADTKIYMDNKIANLKDQVDAINELLSTTGTSSMLLDNLQNDLESEVM